MIQFFCIVCHAPKLRLQSVFCDSCGGKILKPIPKLKKRTEDCGKIAHYYLFDWDDRSEVAARAIVYFLKNKSAEFFQEFVDAVEDFPFGGDTLAIVPPSSSAQPAKGVNHALSLAEALMKQKVVSRVFEAGLVKGANLSQQKQKNREQRLKSKVLDLRAVVRSNNWIFVDDVFVTGGTFQSIFESMFTKPKAVFTLFYRPRLNNKGFYDA